MDKRCPKCDGTNLRPNKNGAGRMSWKCRDCENERNRVARTTAADDPPARDTLRDMPAPKTVHVEETVTVVDEHRLKRKVRDLESQVEHLVKELSDGGEYNELVGEVLGRQADAQPIVVTRRERTSKLREGTPLVLASDWHLEEQVRPEQVAYRNRYNLEIAKQRARRYFAAIHWAITQQRDTFVIRDLIVALMGDFITNFLHEDDVENNLLAPLDAVMFAYECLVGGFDSLLEDPQLERIIGPMVDGNHGRTTKKMRAATRTKHSLEVLLYSMLAQHYKNEPRIRFILPTSQFTFLDDVYGKTIRFTHGDTFRFAGGVGGLTVPLLRAIPRWESVRRAELTCLGHWHQRICLPSVMVNGSLIGYNAYAMSIGCPFEAPSQSLRMLDPDRWCGSDIPLWVSERADDVQNK